MGHKKVNSKTFVIMLVVRDMEDKAEVYRLTLSGDGVRPYSIRNRHEKILFVAAFGEDFSKITAVRGRFEIDSMGNVLKFIERRTD